MNSLWSSRSSNDDAPAGKSGIDVADTGVADVGPEPPNRSTTPGAPSRPGLQRNQSQPPPPAVPQPPTQAAPNPPGGNNGPQQPPDSLSLAQLRRIVAEFPRTEPIAYDYVYSDTGPIEEEIDEWFNYQFWQWVRLNTAQRTFDQLLGRLYGPQMGWEELAAPAQERFVRETLAEVQSADAGVRSNAVAALTYLVLGRWSETADAIALPPHKIKAKSAATRAQLDAIKEGVEILADCDGLPIVWDALRKAFEPFWADDAQPTQANSLQAQHDELLNLMTIMYLAMQETIEDPKGLARIRGKLAALNPSLLTFMINTIAKLRWDEASVLPQTQLFLFFWKAVLVVFGGTDDILETKKATSETLEDGKEKDLITASPLDYNIFRQEITSKYPAYIPPQPVIPLEADNTSLLPPLPNQSARNNGANGILPAPPNAQSGGASILHQPVHIATPAPSPPPSPGVGGKGGKKQNYQTNQNFPFMYPPLDASSNSAGGKGGAGLQQILVGRRWEGSDIPVSIREAGELFSSRVRMTRATRQLWDERERFLKFERGWEAPDEDIIDELDLSELTLEEKEELGLVKPKSADGEESEHSTAEPIVDFGPNVDKLDHVTKERLELVESFYNESLPHLQSLVIVLLKAILAIATNLVQTTNGQQHPGLPGQNNPRANGLAGAGPQNGVNGGLKADNQEPQEEDVDSSRSREIAAKAVTGIMVLLLKWLKLSHILKFEYFTQLLLDSNYLPLVLKLFALHDVQQVVESKVDRIENSFFYFCSVRAGAVSLPNPAATEFEEDESDDEAAPPPIKRRRSPVRLPILPEGELASASTGAKGEPTPAPTRPEVDELGYPINPLPKEPITDFSRRNFFSLINYLRVMQKICKGKAHRNLLLVHYKSSNILRKSLKVPQQELRLYTLKLFKNQVPYCGRKWRQSNMRVITAVYLHCRPELRDEWLAGSDVDAEVEEALPLEQALRSLTHWFNVRRYPERMAVEARAALREEQDFFVRELDRLEAGWAEAGGDESVAGSEWEQDGMWPPWP